MSWRRPVTEVALKAFDKARELGYSDISLRQSRVTYSESQYLYFSAYYKRWCLRISSHKYLGDIEGKVPVDYSFNCAEGDIDRLMSWLERLDELSAQAAMLSSWVTKNSKSKSTTRPGATPASV